jgi:hypothetical protein
MFAYLVLSQPPAAAEMNSSDDFAGLCIYGLLTDFGLFNFYSYDPNTKQFCFDETIINNYRRADACSDMIDGIYFSL